jgi:sec-independent protein translocase protein TatA
MFGTQDIVLIGIIVVVLFGATKLPQLGKGLGQAIGNFKKSMNESKELEETTKDSSKNEETQKKESE